MDYFFFSYYACGMRLSDLMTLEWKHIDWDARVIRIRQFKTKRFPDVLPPLCEPAIEILRRWEKYGRNKRFVFDMLPEDYDLKDQNRLYMDRNSKDKTINTSLKGARLCLGITPSLSIHCFIPSLHTVPIETYIHQRGRLYQYAWAEHRSYWSLNHKTTPTYLHTQQWTGRHSQPYKA